jgi:hypothetical protein
MMDSFIQPSTSKNGPGYERNLSRLSLGTETLWKRKFTTAYHSSTSGMGRFALSSTADTQ